MLRLLPACALLAAVAGCAAGEVITGPDGAPAPGSDAAGGLDAPAATPDAPIEELPDASPAADAAADAPRPDARADARLADAGVADARADAACLVDLLVNGDFDSTTGSGADKDTTPWLSLQLEGQRPWLVANAEELAAVGAAPASGGHAAHLGGADGVEHALLQRVAFPIAATEVDLVGRFWVRGGDDDDVLHLDLNDEDGRFIVRIGTLRGSDAGDGYVARRFIFPQQNGRVRVLTLAARADGDQPTDFFVDDLRLEADFCP